jgi:probable F420-dependent oxidoreductase
MRFSTSLAMLRDPQDSDPFRQSFELAQIAEDAGFDTLTIGHHHFMPGNASDPLTVLAAIAARTGSIRIGTGIFQLPIHNPVRVAEQLATVDQISGGRVTLGVGTGWWPLEYEVHGSDYHERGARTQEALEILRLVLGEENTAYQGRFYDFPELTVYPRPVQTPRPPLWVAGVVDAAVERAARLGDAWLCGPVQSLATAKSCLAVYEAACKQVERAPEWVLRRFAWIGSDRNQVMNEVLPRYVEGLLTHWRESVEDESEQALFARLDRGEEVSPEEIATDRLLFGTPDDIIRQVQRFERETGCTHVHAAFGAGMPARDSELSTLGEFEEQAEMIRLFGREVIPAFRNA